MTILAGDIQRTVWTGGSSGYIPFLSVRWPGCQNQQEPNDRMSTCPLECTRFAESHGATSHPQQHPKGQTQWRRAGWDGTATVGQYDNTHGAICPIVNCYCIFRHTCMDPLRAEICVMCINLRFLSFASRRPRSTPIPEKARALLNLNPHGRAENPRIAARIHSRIVETRVRKHGATPKALDSGNSIGDLLCRRVDPPACLSK